MNSVAQVTGSLVVLWWHGIYNVLLVMWLSEYSISQAVFPAGKMANRGAHFHADISLPSLVRDSPQMLKSRSLLNGGTRLTSLQYSLLHGQGFSADPFLSFAGLVKYLIAPKCAGPIMPGRRSHSRNLIPLSVKLNKTDFYH